jgi:anti-sigma28 factor (negative regulator of flagellin synthesis)
MDIKNINNGAYFDPNFSADKVNRQEVSGGKAADAAKNNPASVNDKVSLSNARPDSAKAVGLNELNKLNAASAEKLNAIKAKIVDGSYDSEEVLSKVSRAIADDLQTVPASENSQLSEERKDFLLNDPDVQQTVANKISQELKKL